MGDLRGSPRVPHLFLGLVRYHSGLPLVVPMGSALPIAIGSGRLSIRSHDRNIRAVKIARLGFFPVFYRVEDLIVMGRSAETACFLDGRGESYGLVGKLFQCRMCSWPEVNHLEPQSIQKNQNVQCCPVC